MFDLSGKTALVTGATGGIGKAIATRLHSRGAHVVLHGTSQEKLLVLSLRLFFCFSIIQFQKVLLGEEHKFFDLSL